MYIAVEGCCHGALDEIYKTMQNLERRDNIKIDILLCCGDFQAVRDEADLNCMAVPDKYKSMGSFWEYYSGAKVAPYLTVFIGGNHEASNHLQELPYGGWVAPNIYYMGYASVIKYKGVRIGGISGIFKYHDYQKGHFEKPPYDKSSVRSVYHVRSSEVFKLKLLKNPLDIMMSHDWPQGIVFYGNVPELLRAKPFFESDIQRNRLGSPPLMELLQHMKPDHWFSGHLHVKFTALVEHNFGSPSPWNPPKATRFLALDKCLPRRNFLQVVKIDTPENCEQLGLCYDEEWLAVLKATNDLLSVSRNYVNLPRINDLGSFPQYQMTPERVEEVRKLFSDDMTIPQNFERDTSVSYDPKNHNWKKQVSCKTSRQTAELCGKLGIDDPLMMALSTEGGDLSLSFNNSSLIDADDIPSTIVSHASINEDEIDLGSDDDEDKDKAGDAKNTNGSDRKINNELADLEESVASEPSFDISCNNSGAINNNPVAAAVSSSLPIGEDNDKVSSSSEPKKGVTRLSLNLPPPVFGATSTPIRMQNSTGNDKRSDGFIPIESISDDTPKKTNTVAKNAVLLSLRGKRLSDTDSDGLESNSEKKSTAPKKFKRRNESFYTSQSENDMA